MAADFWASSHRKRWLVDRATVHRARAQDLHYADRPHLDYLAIYFANVITKLGKKLGLRQRVIATATVFFRRFYLKNSYCETDPFLVIAACCYVAAKAEESPVHIKTVIAEARSLFSQDMYNVKNFPTDNSKLAEMEFYLVNDLECDLTVFHPYRTLLTLCKKESDDSATPAEEGEAGELAAATASGYGPNVGVGVGAEDGPRYWGTGEGRLELSTGALQTAWFIINDTYRSDICLLYPPHLIAIAAIYLTFILHNPTRTTITPLLSSPSSTPPQTSEPPSTSKPRRSSRNASHSRSTPEKKPQQDPITFLSELTVSLPLIATISQEIISLYTLWDRYKEDAHPEAKPPTSTSTTTSTAASTSTTNPTTPGNANPTTPAPDPISLSLPANNSSDAANDDDESYITPTHLSSILLRMREARVMDVAARSLGLTPTHTHPYTHAHEQGHGSTHTHASTSSSAGQQPHHPGSRLSVNVPMNVGSVGVGVSVGMQRSAVNKMLERTQAAG